MMTPLAVYLHIPFCLRKCNYCDFYSVVAPPEQIGRYVDALSREITLMGERLGSPAVSSIYMGGGTPSLLPPLLAGQILETLTSAFAVLPDAEVSMEANPGTVSYPVWKQYINQGINRISLGVQSLADQNLQLLGRIHSTEDTIGAISALQRMKFANYNIDLIYGIPGQTIDSLRRELVVLRNFLGHHLSAYSLQVEEGTPLYAMVESGSMSLPSEDITAVMYELIQEFADDAGLRQYELSNWAKPGHECRHNLAYWQMRPYLGLGAGAVSRLDNRRVKNIPDVNGYIDSLNQGMIKQETLEVMDKKAMVQEYLVMGLRLMKGISLSEFGDRFGHSVSHYYADFITQGLAEGSLAIDDDFLKLTPAYYLLANQILCRL